MRRIILVCALLLFACAGAEEAFSFDALQRTVDAAGSETDLGNMFLSFLDGDAGMDAEAILKSAIAKFREAVFGVSKLLSAICACVFVGALAKRLMPDGKSGKTAAFFVNLFVAYTVFRLSQSVFKDTATALNVIKSLTGALTPLLTAFLALTGGTKSASLITPMGAFASGLMTEALITGGGTIIRILTALTVSEALGGVKVTRLRAFGESLFKWLSGTSVGVFFALMTTGGLLAGAYDGTFVRGAKHAAANLIPIVGSEIAGRMESIVSGAQLIRSAAGITGLFALFSVSIGPVMTVFACAWGLRFISAISECVADEETVRLLEGFSKLFLCALTLLVSSCAMIIILIGAAIGMGARLSG